MSATIKLNSFFSSSSSSIEWLHSHAPERQLGQFICNQCQSPPIFVPFNDGEWPYLRTQPCYRQKWGTKRSAQRCSFWWYKLRPSNSTTATNRTRRSVRRLDPHTAMSENDDFFLSPTQKVFPRKVRTGVTIILPTGTYELLFQSSRELGLSSRDFGCLLWKKVSDKLTAR